mmetsp:Transcript_12053/g.36179  ORF Transcript_12053/g.36179 Transcript_12053/m.36179 type:complete len:118 (-) Transcript_12053:734-1087(-)
MRFLVAGRCVLVEGEHLNIAMSGAQQVLAPDVQAARDIEGAELRAVPDPPLVLYCIESSVLQAEKLRPMFSTPDVSRYLCCPARLTQSSCRTLHMPLLTYTAPASLSVPYVFGFYMR